MIFVALVILISSTTTNSILVLPKCVMKAASNCIKTIDYYIVISVLIFDLLEKTNKTLVTLLSTSCLRYVLL